MKTLSVCARTALAAGLCTAGARADDPRVIGDFEPSGGAGLYVYVNAKTGERVVTRPGVSRSGDVFWQNSDYPGSCFFYDGVDRPTRDTVATGRAKFGAAVVHWGDLPAGSLVDGYDVAYITTIGSDGGLSEPVRGLSMVNMFMDDYDGMVHPGGAGSTVIAGFRLDDLYGAFSLDPPPLVPYREYSVDLEGSGYEFALGADDLDGDGLHDFGYSYEFVQGQIEPKGIIGPVLVRPASLGGAGSATGCPDLHDWFNQTSGGTGSLTDYVGPFSFGGGDCGIPRPYSSFFLNLYGVSGDALCARIDYNADGLIDFSDYLEFLTRFDSADVTADLNGDGLVDFGDYLEFLNLYDTCKS